MSFDSTLIHRVAIMRPIDGPGVDDYNQPDRSWEALAVVDARIVPKSGRQLEQVNEAGPVRGLFTTYMRPTDVAESDHLVLQSTGEVYEIMLVQPRSGAGLHHLELDTSRVWP